MDEGHICDTLGANQFVGLLLARVLPHGNMHLGITYRHRGEAYLYHQAFHLHTRHETYGECVTRLGGLTLVVALEFRRDRQKAIAGFLDRIAAKDARHPYSFRYDPKSTIDERLGRLVTREGIGLNCVTFVLALLNSCQVRLVDIATWPDARPEDRQAQQELADWLEKHPDATPGHREAVRAEIGCTRVRPEEAAGAGCYTVFPVKFPDAEQASLVLLQRIAAKMQPPEQQNQQ